MFKRLVLFFFCISAIYIMIGCYIPPQYSSKSYFDGAVIVDYKDARDYAYDNDCLTFKFYEEGDYEILFSITPKKSYPFSRKKLEENLPENFTKVIKTPREFSTEQHIPPFLRITIVKNGKSEFHDFS